MWEGEINYRRGINVTADENGQENFFGSGTNNAQTNFNFSLCCKMHHREKISAVILINIWTWFPWRWRKKIKKNVGYYKLQIWCGQYGRMSYAYLLYQSTVCIYILDKNSFPVCSYALPHARSAPPLILFCRSYIFLMHVFWCYFQSSCQHINILKPLILFYYLSINSTLCTVDSGDCSPCWLLVTAIQLRTVT